MLANSKTIRLGFMIAMTAALCACQSSQLSYTGRVVSEERRIVILGGGPHSGSWQTDDLKLDYEYRQAQQSFNIAGAVNFRHPKVIWTFRLDVHFADSTGAIIESRNLVAGGNRQMIDTLSFEENLNIPSNAANMSFSYTGRSSGTGNSGSPNDFWATP